MRHVVSLHLIKQIGIVIVGVRLVGGGWGEVLNYTPLIDRHRIRHCVITALLLPVGPRSEDFTRSSHHG